MERFVYYETPGMIAYYGNHEYLIIKDTSAQACIHASRTNFLFTFARKRHAWKLTRARCGVGVKSMLYHERGQRRGETEAAELLARATEIIRAMNLPDNYRSDYIKRVKICKSGIKFILGAPDLMNEELERKHAHIIARPDLYVGAAAKMRLLRLLPQPIAEEVVDQFRFFGPTKYARVVAKVRRLYVVMTSADPDIIRTKPQYSRGRTVEELRQNEEQFKKWRAENYTFWIKTKFGWRRLVWWNQHVWCGDSWVHEINFVRRMRAAV